LTDDRYRDRMRMLISCPDRPGIVAAVSRFLYENGANIVRSDQHTTDPRGGHFFMRVEFDLEGAAERWTEVRRAFAGVAQGFGMSWRLECAWRVKRLAVFVSREDHCLFELVRQQQAGDLRAEIALVVSNHPDLAPVVAAWGIPFHHVPVAREAREEAERRQLRILDGRADLVVLARYMQILSPAFVEAYPRRIINIHHSFLPAFAGARPYAQAYERGVKLIGATAHYVTEELDQGPIIEQDVQRVDHRDGVDDLRRIGRHIERTVLARAVAWHCEDRILVHRNKTVVFA
jgi:formyltetrahydrofolate deformylase